MGVHCLQHGGSAVFTIKNLICRSLIVEHVHTAFRLAQPEIFSYIVTLNPEAYYVPYVPIEINFWYVLWLNIGCMLVSVLMLIAPSYLVALIRPAKSIKFE